MNYFLIALLTTSITALVLHLFLNRILQINLRMLPLILCAACSLFISMALPKIVVRHADLMGTCAVLAIFSVICSYLLAYYDEKISNEPNLGSEMPLHLSEAQNQNQDFGDLSAKELVTMPLQNTIQQDLTDHNTVCETEANPSRNLQLSKQEQNTVNVSEVSDLCTPESFDQQLELAFQLKGQHDFRSAARLFQKILNSNRNSEAAPLVILQIADSLMSAGEYQQAINLLSDSLSSADCGNTAIEQQINELLTKLHLLRESEKTGGTNI